VRKTEQVHVRVDPADKAAMEREAERLGLSLSAYLLFLHRRHVERERDALRPPSRDTDD
jgi:hypothetical protein